MRNQWNVIFKDDPINQHQSFSNNNNSNDTIHTSLLEIKTKLSCLLPQEENEEEKQQQQQSNTILKTFQSIPEEKIAYAALCDYISRQINTNPKTINGKANNNELRLHAEDDETVFQMTTLDIQNRVPKRNKNHDKNSNSNVDIPFILERSDVIWYKEGDDDEYSIQITCRLFYNFAYDVNTNSILNEYSKQNREIEIAIPPLAKKTNEPQPITIIHKYLSKYIASLQSKILTKSMMEHVCSCILQERIRNKLSEEYDAIAFIADGSILPRKSSSSYQPLNSANVIPFQMNDLNSTMCSTIDIDMGNMKSWVLPILPQVQQQQDRSTSFITLKGLLIYKGITLIVGGAYHGKSTLLSTISLGIYNKIPNDGREYCITNPTALSIRAEDGRYVGPYQNLSAFLSNLPFQNDMSKFETSQASGSTSMAVNVMEGIELLSKVFLIDEDLSATNFMSRDGRMRALIANESLIPLLYRVNSIYTTLDISSIVVIGGVGDWLDVPHHVIMLDKYVVYDVTKKAKSISATFSYGHVQYGGRGVVHRLEWDKGVMNPYRRCVHQESSILFQDAEICLENGNDLSLIPKEREEEEEEIGSIDVQRCEQMIHNLPPYLYGCAICISYILNTLCNHEEQYDLSTILQIVSQVSLQEIITKKLHPVINNVGYIIKPRSLDVLCMLLRIRGMKYTILPKIQLEDDVEKERLDKERKQKALMELWNSRR